MRGVLLLSVLLAGILLLPAYLRAETAELPGESVAALCYRGVDGYMVSSPPGWVNQPEAAASFGVCVMYVPVGYDFGSAPAIIYPRLVARPAGPDPVQALADTMLAYFTVCPDGYRTTVEPGPSLDSLSGLFFQTRYFNNGPNPNNFELVAYNSTEENVMLLVLSARTEGGRRASEEAFRQVIYDLLHLEVKREAGQVK